MTALTEWANGRVASRTNGEAEHHVILVPDAFTNYLEPEIGRATVHLLEAAGVAVHVRDDLPPVGRAAYSQGFIERARGFAETMVAELEPAIEDGWDVIVPEPSAAAMIQSDYTHLLGEQAGTVLEEATYTPLEYLDVIDAALPVDPPSEPFVIHDHCHQQSIDRGGTAERLLAEHGYVVETVDSGCCGMAGSFGYHREHYDLSRSIADILLAQLNEYETDQVLATGTSCRSQLEHVAPDLAVEHPVIRLASDLRTEG